MAKAGSTEKVVREIRRHTRRRFSAEEKIRIVLEGLRGEESIAALWPAASRRSRPGHAWRAVWRVPVFGGVGPPRRRVCRDRGPTRPVWLGREPWRTDGRCPAPPRPAAASPCRGAAQLYAVPRRTRRRGAAEPTAWGRRRAGAPCACCAR